jgi:hypothetical protein
MVPKEVAVLLEDFNALASSLAIGVVDVRGCLIVSRDGLVLGAYPADAETTVGPAWVRFGDMGNPERGFAQFGTETWCYVRRGPYAGFAVVGPGARPGLVIDHMDQVLLAAEDARSRHEGVRGIEPPVIAPVSKPRSHLHRGQRSASGEEAGDHSASTPQEPIASSPSDVPVEQGAWESLHRAATEPTHEPEDEPDDEPEEEPPYGAQNEPRDGEDDVDRFSLVREFGRLLQHREDAADG